MSTDGRSCASCRSVTKASAGKPYDLRFTISQPGRVRLLPNPDLVGAAKALVRIRVRREPGGSLTLPGGNRKSQIANRKSILVLVENLPVPLDRRVWQEACALRDAGYEVAVICPRMRGFTKPEE